MSHVNNAAKYAELKAGVDNKMQAMINLATEEGRSFTDEEAQAFDTLEKESQSHKDMIARSQRLQEQRREEVANIAAVDICVSGKSDNANQEVTNAFNKFLLTGKGSNSLQNALSQDSDTSGGYLVPAEVLSDKTITPIDELNFIRNLAAGTTIIGAKSLGIPSIADDLDDVEWTTEISTGTEDDITFGKRSIEVNELDKLVKISRKLIKNAGTRATSIVMNRLNAVFARTEEKHFLVGSGSGQPLGVFTASSNGINTDRDVVAASATDITGDDFVDALFDLPQSVQSNAVWVMHPDLMKRIAKLKTTDGDYIFQKALTDKIPHTILGRPVYTSKYAPNTIAANQYVAVLGDFNHYQILDSGNYEVDIANELYRETKQVGYFGHKEVDGAPINSEAFVRLKMAAA